MTLRPTCDTDDATQETASTALSTPMWRRYLRGVLSVLPPALAPHLPAVTVANLPLPMEFAMVLRRLARARRPRATTETQPDGVPKRGLFEEPVRVTKLQALESDVDEGGVKRASFLVEIKDREDRRCSDVAVEARLTGPERHRTVQGTTDMMGRIRFRMASGSGTYRIELTDVAAGGLDWDRAGGPREADTSID